MRCRPSPRSGRSRGSLHMPVSETSTRTLSPASVASTLDHGLASGSARARSRSRSPPRSRASGPPVGLRDPTPVEPTVRMPLVAPRASHDPREDGGRTFPTAHGRTSTASTAMSSRAIIVTDETPMISVDQLSGIGRDVPAPNPRAAEAPRRVTDPAARRDHRCRERSPTPARASSTRPRRSRPGRRPAGARGPRREAAAPCQERGRAVAGALPRSSTCGR